MSHLLFDPSTNVQKMAYELLREASHKRTEYLVIEAGVDTESIVKPLLPLELVSLLRRSLDIVDIEEDPSSVRLMGEAVFIYP
jgi:E3 ubiquitin-protein ligase listerin